VFCEIKLTVYVNTFLEFVGVESPTIDFYFVVSERWLLLRQVCKWNYDALGTADGNDGKPGWDAGFLASIGLSELLVGAPANPIGSVVSSPGEPVGSGLQQSASADLGLPVGTPVGVSMIDAHAGGLGVLGALVPPVPGAAATATAAAATSNTKEGADGSADAASSSSVSDAEMASRMALIAGTSCCHMLSSKEPVFVPGVWGPYASAMIPGLALNEGGQSAAGKLLDFVTSTHAAYPELLERAKQVFLCFTNAQSRLLPMYLQRSHSSLSVSRSHDFHF